MKNNRP